VKIRGIRVELGEIERVLGMHPDVKDAVVAKWEPAPGDHRLAGYVVPAGDTAPDPVELRGFLADRLPPYMVPAHFMTLPELALTPSGKVDRKRLPLPEEGAAEVDATASRPPRTEAELLVAEAWGRHLPVAAVDADFFGQGGNSLLATKIISALRRALDRELPLVLLFDHPTIEELAKAIEDTLRVEGETR
jgi:hypothetical protein